MTTRRPSPRSERADPSPSRRQPPLPATTAGSPARGGLDQVDLKLLKLLAADARLSQRALARAIGMSAAAVSERVARLEGVGVIVGYHAAIDYAALDRTLTAHVAIRSSAASTDHLEIARRLMELPEVESVDVVMGPMDLVAKLRVRDTAHLRAFYFDTFLQVEGVGNTESYMVLAALGRDNYVGDLLQAMDDQDG